MHILLIEPDTILAQMYIDTLEGAGHSVSYVMGAEAAIHTADRKKPDMVVLEIRLPGHSGVAFLQEFRSYADWLDIPIILHTMVYKRELQAFDNALKEMGVAEVLYKPHTTLRQLILAIDSCTRPVS